MKIQKNVLLKNYTTFKIGGQAKYFCVTENKEDLIEAVAFAKKGGLPFFILGGGSNLLVADKGFNGLVIKIKNSNLKIQKHKSKFKIICGAGMPLAKLIYETYMVGAIGMEWAVGIPGATLGGAVRGNAGAFETEMKDLVRKVEVFDVKNQKMKIFSNKDCRFGYRGSIFKKNPNLIIWSCELKFKKGNKREIRDKIREILNYRKGRHPAEPSAGSIFKNLENVRAGDLIERAGLKGKRIGGAQISDKHSNFIINLGGAGAKDVLKLINLAKKEVKNIFGIEIEEEIQFLGKI